MILRVLLPFIIAMLPVSAFAADGELSPLAQNKWALQFGIERELDLVAFEYGTFSIKRQMNPRSALRFGFGFRYEKDNDTNNSVYNSLVVLYQRYVTPDRPAKFYWGLGPVFRVSNRTSESTSNDNYYKSEITQIATGLFGAVGIEWFANNVISFHAEYRSFAQYNWRKIKSEQQPAGEEMVSGSSKTDNFEVNAESSVLFGMSIYF